METPCGTTRLIWLFVPNNSGANAISVATDGAGNRQPTTGAQTSVTLQAPGRVVTARLVMVKVGKKQRLVVQVFENGVKTRQFSSPFQKPAYKNIQVSVHGTQVVLTAKKGKKTVTTILAG